MITLSQVTKTYYNGECPTPALKGIDLTVEDGEYIAIMGTSGSGKSTLLNIIGGMDTLTEGEYFYNDIPVHQLKGNELHQFRKEHVSFVFQQFALMNHYTVFENVEIPLLAKGFPKKERKRIVMERLEQMGIADLAKKLPIHISGGQQQRCAIARALASDNSIILADEPTGALDKNTGMEIMTLLQEINQQGKTLLVITHDPGIAAMAHRIIRLEDGCIQE
ncbi:MAG: ABC transporter ATP-binding protein [Lachnospiraceae bacterium]|nr:ABC transporter ATP-binding protein [Lachnospiraceae bacterium]